MIITDNKTPFILYFYYIYITPPPQKKHYWQLEEILIKVREISLNLHSFHDSDYITSQLSASFLIYLLRATDSLADST